MITTIDPLKSARDRWLGSGGDPRLFDRAVTVLDSATANTDVVRGLQQDYVVKHVGDRASPVYGIYVDHLLMLKYQLHEAGADADVELIG